VLLSGCERQDGEISIRSGTFRREQGFVFNAKGGSRAASRTVEENVAQPITAADTSQLKRMAWGGFWLGVALGGFFDGILLHQILQWHHLLSGVAATETASDLRFQILADGLFHVSHYVFAVVGLWLIWSGRSVLTRNSADRRLIAWALIGFGAWHIIDAVVSHWVLGLHRIRMDVDNPLVWDLLWVIPFGVALLAAGLWMLRNAANAGGGPSRGPTVAASLALAALLAGPIAAVPPRDLLDNDMTLVVFRPGISFAAIVDAADAVDGSLVWTDESRGVWLISVGPEASPSSLYRHGALLVSNGLIGVGCLSWSEI
jgi:uncharacterized membrane protein